MLILITVNEMLSIKNVFHKKVTIIIFPNASFSLPYHTIEYYILIEHDYLYPDMYYLCTSSYGYY